MADEFRPPDTIDALSLLTGGEMRGLTYAKDWSQTPLGPMSQWPQSLKSAVELMLTSRYPMLVWWGPDLIQFYNDAYIQVMGKRHPQGLGEPAAQFWASAWPAVGKLADAVMTEGVSTWSEQLEMTMVRNGWPEEVYMTFSYSPISDEAGRIAGLFCACTEETPRVLSERRMRTLRALAENTSLATTTEEACGATVAVFDENVRDLPFSLLYLLDHDQRVASLAGATGLAADTSASPARIDVDDTGQPWPLQEVLRTGRSVKLSDLSTRFGPLPSQSWPEPVERAVILPLARPGHSRLAGFLVVGISPRLALDEGYLTFFELLARQVATAISNARAYEEERRRAESLAEIDRAKTAFFSNVSHEFRTPLTLLLGPLEETLASASLAEETREELAVVHRNALRLLRLVNTLLDFSRVEAGRAQASYEPTDIAALTAELASNFRSACEQAGLRLLVDCQPTSEAVFLDREMWEKIVLNLVSNAFKFTFEGEIEVRIRSDAGSVILTVRDTGTGIPDAELPKIFDRFQRVANARGRTHEGTGIGLALVQELVRLHGGTIGVESALGRGTTFTVRIPFGTAHLPADCIDDERPLASTATRANAFVEEALRWLPDPRTRPDPTVSPGTADAELDRTERPRVLLVDDNADMRDYVKRLLGRRYEVETATDGVMALDLIAQRHPDLVLADVMMPRLDGFGLLKALRGDKRTRDLPVILLSARAGEESRVEGLEAGADDYLVKPFSARELMARVSANLEAARVRRQAAEAALRESEERHRLILESALDYAIFTTDREGAITSWPPGAQAVLGGTAEEMIGQNMAITFVPEDRESGVPEKERIEAREKGRAENVRWHQRLDGSRVFIEGWARPLLDGDGEVIGFLKIGRDATEQKATAERMKVLVAELQHRTRNLMGVVRSIGDRTLAGSASLAEFQERFRDRIGALARVNGLLSQLNQDDRIGFDELIRTELAGHGIMEGDGHGPQVTLEGPPGVRLRSATVQTFALGLHELTTNAVKHGAFSRPEGRLLVRWSLIDGEDGDRRLQVEWQESGVPVPSSVRGQPYRRGSGRELIERALPYQLGAETTYELTPDGVRCTITLPISTTHREAPYA